MRINFLWILFSIVFLIGFAHAESYYVGQVIQGLDGGGKYNGQAMSVKILGIVSSGPYAETYSLRLALYDKENNVADQAVVEPGTDLRYVFFDSEGNFALKSSLEINEINLNVSETPRPGANQENGQQGEVTNGQDTNDGGQATGEEETIDANGTGENAGLQYCEDGIHKTGESWSVECNTCSCGNDGVVTCTKINCNAQEQADENQAGQDNGGQQPGSTGIIESIMQFFRGLLKFIFV